MTKIEDTVGSEVVHLALFLLFVLGGLSAKQAQWQAAPGSTLEVRLGLFAAVSGFFAAVFLVLAIMHIWLGPPSSIQRKESADREGDA